MRESKDEVRLDGSTKLASASASSLPTHCVGSHRYLTLIGNRLLCTMQLLRQNQSLIAIVACKSGCITSSTLPSRTIHRTQEDAVQGTATKSHAMVSSSKANKHG
jgi:hypothetical protein